MKRWIAILIAFVLLSGPMCCIGSALAESAERPVFRIGDIVHGFSIKEIREFSPIQAQLVLFEHQRTGAKILYISNDDTNRLFCFAFDTPRGCSKQLDILYGLIDTDKSGPLSWHEYKASDDSASQPYIIPIKYNDDTLIHIVSSMDTFGINTGLQSESSILQAAEKNLKSCLYPAFLEDEDFFREYAWHFQLDGLDSPLSIQGPAYSDAPDFLKAVQDEAFYLAFPGSVGLDDANAMDFVNHLDWEQIKAFHRQFYHPTNLTAFLYGQYDDYAAFLNMLDMAFSTFEKQASVYQKTEVHAVSEPLIKTMGMPVGEVAQVPQDYYYAPFIKRIVENAIFDTITSMDFTVQNDDVVILNG